jgi:thiamine-phosphate pyrophosphorylase
MTEKPCGLISGIPATLQGEWARRLPEFLTRFRPAALVAYPPFEANTKALIAAGKGLDLAVLVHDDLDEAVKLEAAGVYLSRDRGWPFVVKARERLGSAAILGAAASLQRHDAMEKAEAGVDFVGFGLASEHDLSRALDLVRWWEEMMVLPCALQLSTFLPPFGAFSKGRPDFLFWDETLTPGESLSQARNFALDSEEGSQAA